MNLVLNSKSESALGRSQLPAGLESKEYRVVCTADIFDSYSASSSLRSEVTVHKGAERNSSQALSYIESILSEGSSSADGIKQSNALGSYLLNVVNCSLAPDCAALNRANCFRTEHTCGDCISSSFVGDEGDSNEACVDVNTFSSSAAPTQRRSLGSQDVNPNVAAAGAAVAGAAAAAVCSSSFNCTGFQSCINGRCVLQQKQCPGNCSSQGTCLLVDSKFGKEVSDCRVGDSRCRAVCDCEEAYWGSTACNIPATDLVLKRQSRLQIIRSIQRLMELEEADVQTIVGWMNSLSGAAQAVDELSQEGAYALLEAAATVVDLATEAGVNAEAIFDLLSSVDSAMSSTSEATNQRRRRQRRRMAIRHPTSTHSQAALSGVLPLKSLDSNTTNNNSSSSNDDIEVEMETEDIALRVTVQRVEQLLQQFGDLAASGLVPGQDAVQVVMSQFRMSVQKLSFSSSSTINNPGQNISLAVPASALEGIRGERGSTVSLPVSSGGAPDVTVSIRSLRPQVLNDEAGVSDELLQFQSGSPVAGVIYAAL